MGFRLESPAARLLPPLVILGLAVLPAHGWHTEGHLYPTVAAVEALPDDVPAHFRERAMCIGRLAVRPDVKRDRDLPQLFSTEGPEHYFNLERLEGAELPETRYRFLHLCERMDINPYRVGTAPYAVAEWTQRLTLAFAEHRADPESEHVRAKCLVYAGILAHYAADLQMPLHTSIHHDGRADADGESPRTGIHQKVDALPTMVPFNEMFAEPLPAPRHAFGPGGVFGYIVEELMASHALVDDVYEMEDAIPPRNEPIESERVRAFTIERMRASATYIANLYHSAWVNSAEIELPHWLERDAVPDEFDRDRVPARFEALEQGAD